MVMFLRKRWLSGGTRGGEGASRYNSNVTEKLRKGLWDEGNRGQSRNLNEKPKAGDTPTITGKKW